MSSGTYLGMLGKRWLSVAVLTVLGVAIGGGVTLVTKKSYEATAQIFVSVGVSTDSGSLNSANAFTVARVQSYVAVAGGPSVTIFVVKKLGLQMTNTALSKEISADAPLNKVLLNIHVKDKSATQSATLANAVAYRMVTVIENLETARNPTRGSPVTLTVTKPADVPGSPTQPRASLNLGLGLLIGLLLGLALARLRDQYDDRVRTVEELEAEVHCPVLGVIPQGAGGLRRQDAEPFATDHLQRQSFAQLQASLPFLDLDSPPRVFCLAGASSGAGTTYVAANLAHELSRAHETVCLVEANLRSPTLLSLLKLPRQSGLTSVLTAKEPLERVVQSMGGSLSAIIAGPIPPNPGSVFASEQARQALVRTAQNFQFVVLDCAAITATEDARVAVLAEATLLVVRRGHTRRRDLRRAVDALAEVGIRPAGAVLNMVRRPVAIKRVGPVVEQAPPTEQPDVASTAAAGA